MLKQPFSILQAAATTTGRSFFFLSSPVATSSIIKDDYDVVEADGACQNHLWTGYSSLEELDLEKISSRIYDSELKSNGVHYLTDNGIHKKTAKTNWSSSISALTMTNHWTATSVASSPNWDSSSSSSSTWDSWDSSSSSDSFTSVTSYPTFACSECLNKPQPDTNTSPQPISRASACLSCAAKNEKLEQQAQEMEHMKDVIHQLLTIISTNINTKSTTTAAVEDEDTHNINNMILEDVWAIRDNQTRFLTTKPQTNATSEDFFA